MSTTPPAGRREPWPPQAADAVRDLRGGVRLLVDGLRHGLHRLEAGHERLASVEPPVRARIGRPGTGIGALVWRGLRGTTDLAGGAVDLTLASLQAWLLDPHRERMPAPPQPAREAAVALLNAVLGDHLHRTDNPLAVHLRLRRDEAVPVEPRVLLMAHDLGRSDLHWRQGTHDHGRALAQAFACTPVHVVYNSGRPVAATGRELATELEVLLAHWRLPLQGAVLLGHGMGGLVLRSALHQAQRAGMAWPAHVRRLVFLGTPHHGADASMDLLSRLGAGPLGGVPLGRLARRRSPGMRDFLDGRVLEEETGVPQTPALQAAAGLPAGVPAYAIAGAIGDGRHDGIVPVESALGRHPDAGRGLPLAPEHRWVAQGVDHDGLLRSEAVLQKMRQWLSD
jgi:hypothetical protein